MYHTKPIAPHANPDHPAGGGRRAGSGPSATPDQQWVSPPELKLDDGTRWPVCCRSGLGMGDVG